MRPTILLLVHRYTVRGEVNAALALPCVCACMLCPPRQTDVPTHNESLSDSAKSPTLEPLKHAVLDSSRTLRGTPRACFILLFGRPEVCRTLHEGMDSHPFRPPERLPFLRGQMPAVAALAALIVNSIRHEANQKHEPSLAKPSLPPTDTLRTNVSLQHEGTSIFRTSARCRPVSSPRDCQAGRA